MWKRLKLVVLLLLTIGLVAWIYPIWRDLTTSRESTLLTNSAGQVAGGLTLFIGPGTTNDVRMDLISDYASETDNGGRSPSPTADLRVDGLELTAQSLNPAPSYLVASGTAGLLLDSCKPGFAPDPNVPLSKPIGYSDLPDKIKQHVPEPASAIEIHGIGVTCQEPTDAFWTFAGARHTFVSPPLEVVVEGPIDVDLVSKDPKRGTENGPFCSRVILGYRQGVTVDAQAPPAIKDPDQAFGDMSSGPSALSWGQCPKVPATVGNIFWDQPEVTVELTDIRQADKYNQELFLGGVLLGVLGALVIECVGTGFEVMEARFARRTLRDEQEPRPEPEPPEPDAAPDDEVDRDQLPLF